MSVSDSLELWSVIGVPNDRASRGARWVLRRILRHPAVPGDMSTVATILREYPDLWDCVQLQDMDKRGYRDSYVFAAVTTLGLLKWWRLYGVPMMDTLYPRSNGNGWKNFWCAPVGVYIRPRLHWTCRLKACPWCYARKWSDAHRFLARKLARHEVLYYTEIVGDLDSLTKETMGRARRISGNMRQKLGLSTTALGFNTEPVLCDGELDGWKLCSGCISLEQPASAIGVEHTTKVLRETTVKQTRIKAASTLRRCVAHLFRYPMHLFTSPIEVAAQYAEVVTKTRPVSWTGDWRPCNTDERRHFHRSRYSGTERPSQERPSA